MIYKNEIDYLNEEIRKPIRKLLKGYMVENEVMEIVDYLCDKYREVEGCCKYYEKELSKPINTREFIDFIENNNYGRPIDYDNFLKEEEFWSAQNADEKW